MMLFRFAFVALPMACLMLTGGVAQAADPTPAAKTLATTPAAKSAAPTMPAAAAPAPASPAATTPAASGPAASGPAASGSKGPSGQPKLVGTFGDWSTYTFNEGPAKVCYVATQPKKAEGNYSSRGDVFFLITNRPAEKTYNVVSVIAGYTFKDASEPTVTIDKKTFTLFTRADRAWSLDEKSDKALSDALRKGVTMVIKGTSSRGTPTVDTYVVKGAPEALNAMNKECGVKSE